MWIWLAIGIGSFLLFAAAVALMRMLRVIAFDISELHEPGAWATLPPTRATVETEGAESERVVRTAPR